MLAYRLRLRNILVAAVEYYDDDGLPGPHPTFLQFPADPLLRGQRVLIVDEVWDSGTTIAAVTDRVRQAGGIPTTAVLHYKPTHSVVEGEPDVFAVADRPLGGLPVQGGRLTGPAGSATEGRRERIEGFGALGDRVAAHRSGPVDARGIAAERRPALLGQPLERGRGRGQHLPARGPRRSR